MLGRGSRHWTPLRDIRGGVLGLQGAGRRFGAPPGRAPHGSDRASSFRRSDRPSFVVRRRPSASCVERLSSPACPAVWTFSCFVSPGSWVSNPTPVATKGEKESGPPVRPSPWEEKRLPDGVARTACTFPTYRLGRCAALLIFDLPTRGLSPPAARGGGRVPVNTLAALEECPEPVAASTASPTTETALRAASPGASYCPSWPSSGRGHPEWRHCKVSNTDPQDC
jgi:hypothetical protein